MNRANEMIIALRKCAKEHENDVVYTGQIITSSLCKDVADYLETDQWHYPSKGEYPKEGENLLCLVSENFDDYRIGRLGTDGLWWTNDGVEDDIVCWQYIEPPQEEVTIKCCENCGHYKNNVCERTKTHPNKPKEWTCLDWKEEA